MNLYTPRDRDLPDGEALLASYRQAQGSPPESALLSELAVPPSPRLFEGRRVAASGATSYGTASLSNPYAPSLQDVVRTFTERMGIDYYGVRVLRRQDPILRLGLASHRDEREWRGMVNSEDAISTSIEALLDTLMGYGWAIRKKDGKATPARQKLEDFAKSSISGGALGRRFQSVLRLACMARFYGWQPFQLIWSPGAFRFGGRSFRGITKIVEQKAEHFAWTVPENGRESALVFMGDGYYPPSIYDNPEEARCWLAIQSGSLFDPYGESKLSKLWFAWYRLRRFTEFYEIGARDALTGRPVFQARGASTGGNGPQMGPGGSSVDGKERAAALARLAQEAAACMTMLRETGALVVGNDLEFKEMADPSKAEGWERANAVIRQALTIAIEGQVLTSTGAQAGGGGSRALGEVHQETKMSKARALAEDIGPQVSEIVHRIIAQNFPGELDPEDLPDIVFAVSRAIDGANVKLVVDLGGIVDGAAVAEALNVPLADLEADGAMQLKRQEVGSLSPGIGAYPSRGQIGPPPPAATAEALAQTTPAGEAPTAPPPSRSEIRDFNRRAEARYQRDVTAERWDRFVRAEIEAGRWDSPPDQLAARTDGPHKFSSTQVNLPEGVAGQVLAFGARIAEEDLAAEGRERDPHVTVKYGIHTTDSGKVAKVLADFGPVSLKLGATELFEAEDCDVLIISVHSPDLKKLNAALSSALAVTDTHPEYQPHVTVAYLKTGAGAKYRGDTALAGVTVAVDSVLFTPNEGPPVAIALSGQRSRTAARATLPAALAALGDHVDAMAGTLEAAEAARVAAPWQSYLRVLTEAATEAAGEADTPFGSDLP